MTYKLTQLEEALSGDVMRIANRLKRFGGTPLVTLVVRPPKGSGERDVVMTTDEPEAVVASIRRMTGRAAGASAMDVAIARVDARRPLQPTTIEEARSEAMGLLLGVIDASNALRPPDGTSADSALAQWSVMVERAAYDMYGESWSAFVQHVRKAN
jgi:hypothetical protein